METKKTYLISKDSFKEIFKKVVYSVQYDPKDVDAFKYLLDEYYKKLSCYDEDTLTKTKDNLLVNWQYVGKIPLISQWLDEAEEIAYSKRQDELQRKRKEEEPKEEDLASPEDFKNILGSIFEKFKINEETEM